MKPLVLVTDFLEVGGGGIFLVRRTMPDVQEASRGVEDCALKPDIASAAN